MLENIGINDGITVPFRLIQRRIRQNKPFVLSANKYSPLAPVDHGIVQIVVLKQEAGQPINPIEGTHTCAAKLCTGGTNIYMYESSS